MTTEDFLKGHPELKTIDNDQKTISASVLNYLEEFSTSQPNFQALLNEFFSQFTAVEKFDLRSTKNLKGLSSSTLARLVRIAENYISLKGVAGIKKGEILDLRNESDSLLFQKQLKEFANKVKKLPTPEKLDLNLDSIGKLPVVEIKDSLLRDKVANIWTLDVSHNPGGSIKDVMAKEMIENALVSGELGLDKIIVEGTSGNTGAGLAIVALKKGIKVILTIPSKMSPEKIERLLNLGANVVVTPTDVSPHDTRSYYAARDYIAKEIGGWKANQYNNLTNSLAHEKVTGPRIWEQTQGKVTALVATVGTAGTISGIGRFLKSKNPDIKIIGVDSIGSILYLLHAGYSINQVEKYASHYTIQGFGEDIHPENLDLSVIDHFLRIGDATGLNVTRILPRLGFVMGHSSGAAYAGMIEAISQNILTPEDNVMVIFPDSGVPYRHDVFNKNWMKLHNFLN